MSNDISLAIKVDVDTERGTRVGVPALLALFAENGITATFLFSLGPDNTGRAIRRIFRPGFFKKAARTNVLEIYGLRTLLNGVLWPGPHIARRHGEILRATRDAGHEVGIHCYDHIRWQDGLAGMTPAAVRAEFERARAAFADVYGGAARTAGAAGWQANAQSLAVYDEAALEYASDARGTQPFFPRCGDTVFRTLQVPTTLPTLDELLGRPEYPESGLADHYISLLRADVPNVMTVHAEVEGMLKRDWFSAFLAKARRRQIRFVRVEEIARAALARRADVPVCDLAQGSVDGRSGTLALQGNA
jgi:undecaprenyl phosphate-alpha-L-ara4FN deformylase